MLDMQQILVDYSTKAYLLILTTYLNHIYTIEAYIK